MKSYICDTRITKSLNTQGVEYNNREYEYAFNVSYFVTILDVVKIGLSPSQLVRCPSETGRDGLLEAFEEA